MPRKKRTPPHRLRPHVSAIVDATLRFANTGIYQFADHPVIEGNGRPPLEWLREFVCAQLQAIADGIGGSLAEIECPAFHQLHAYIRQRFDERQRRRPGEGSAVPATDEERLEADVETVRQATAIGVALLVPVRSRLRRCAHEACRRWFVALDERRLLCGGPCQNLEGPAARTAYTKHQRQPPQAKARA
jgi:hypothetical protein